MRAFLPSLLLCAAFCTRTASGADWDHVHLTADDTLAAARWYAEHFGGKLTKSGPFDAVLFGAVLVQWREGRPSSGSVGTVVDHIGFSVENVHATLSELDTAGTKILSRARRLEVGGFSFAFVEDPWGTKIELLDDGEPGFHHVHLATADPQATLVWYENAFEGEPSDFRRLSFIPGLRYGDIWLLVAKAQSVTTPNDGSSLDHIAWSLQDLDATVERLRAAGVEILVEPVVSGDRRVAFVRGPDGARIELIEAR